MDWNQELERLSRLIQSSPEKNRKALPEFLLAAEKARIDDSLDAGKAIWWIASMIDQRMGSKEAELLYTMALQKLERHLGAESPLLAGVLHSLAYYLADKGRYLDSEQYYRRIIGIRAHADPEQTAEMSAAITDFSASLESQGRLAEAQELIKLCERER